MQLICFSVTHHSMPVELRECLSLSPERVAKDFATHPIRSGAFGSIYEMVILSTCNRLEIYALVTSSDSRLEEAMETAAYPLVTYLEDVFGIPNTWIDLYFRRYNGIQAVEHLFQVSAGLDSIAIGETQILGQVSRALELGLQLDTARHVLSSLFRSAIHTGKRVRTETEIGRHPTSISTLGVELAERSRGSLTSQNILIIGAGKMGQHTLEYLSSHGANRIYLMNRTFDHAIELASRLGIEALPYDQMFDGLVNADIVFTSTAAPQPILSQSMILEVMAYRSGQPLTLVDLSVPRNVEKEVHKVPNVQVFDMDDLQAYAKTAANSSSLEISRADAIVAEEVTEYEKLLHVIPFLGELHKKAEDIRQREVEKTLRQLRTTDPQISEQIDLLTRSLVRKILHEPTMHLRTESNRETLNDYVETLTQLFDLDEQSARLSFQNRGAK